jgi:putative DNA-invertase from lambdoid prophage Rac
MNIYGYTRVSTTRQSEEGLSIEAQEDRVGGYAKGILQANITRVFSERGISASIPFHKRPMGKELLATVQPGDVIVALRLDRVFRSALDCLRMVEELRDRKVKLCLVDMGDVTENGFARVFMTIAASFAELEKERIRERTLEVHAYRRSLGKLTSPRKTTAIETRGR